MSGPEPTATVVISSFDGVGLATDVYLPEPQKAIRVDCILIRTPYGRRGRLDRGAELAGGLASHGIALVIQDVRSKFDSQGEASPFVQEAADGVATADWIVAQPWSSGRVFPFGDSYPGFAALELAASGHAAVAGVVARVTTVSIQKCWLFDNGVFKLRQNAGWAQFVWGEEELAEAELEWGAASVEAAGFSPRARQLVDSWLGGTVASALPTGDAMARIGVPVLLWGGWWDVMNRGMTADLQRGDSRRVRTIVGATDHSFFPLVAAGRGAAEATVNDRQVLADLVEVLARFVASAPEPLSSCWQIANAGWLDTRESSPELQRRSFYLAGAVAAARDAEGGRLSGTPPMLGGVVVTAFDPDNIVPSSQSSLWSPLATALPDESAIHSRPDVLTFTSDEFDAPLTMFGSMTLMLACRVRGGPGQLIVSVCDVHPDGYAGQILRSATALEQAEDFQTHAVELGHTGYRIEAGHRLRVALAASSYPDYLPGSPTPGEAWPASLQRRYEVHCRLSEATAITVTTLARELSSAPWYRAVEPSL